MKQNSKTISALTLALLLSFCGSAPAIPAQAEAVTAAESEEYQQIVEDYKDKDTNSSYYAESCTAITLTADGAEIAGDGAEYEGGQTIEADAPLSVIPAFVRKGVMEAFRI